MTASPRRGVILSVMLAVASFVGAAGLQISGYENATLAVVLCSAGVALVLLACGLRLWPTRIEFYANRNDLHRRRGGLQQEVRNIDTAWMATWTGVYAANYEVFQSRRITRLILIDPDGGGFAGLATAFWRTAQEVENEILTTTRLAMQSGTDVRWSTAPITGMLIADPESEDGWIRVEAAFPFFADRPGFLVTRSGHSDLFVALKRSFEELWISGNCRTPPPERLADRQGPARWTSV
jgi:hypothetical protein